MKIFISKLLKIAAFPIVLLSCSDEILLPSQSNTNPIQGLNGTRSDDDDEIIALHKRQSDQMSMIIDCIIEKDSVFSLDMSIDESRILGIPDSIYFKGTEIIRSLNTLTSN